MRQSGWVLILVLAVSCVGCVTTPKNWECREHTYPWTVQGYTNAASATVTFYAWNYTEERWDAVGSTTSDSSPLSIWECPEGKLYYFSGTADLSDDDYDYFDGIDHRSKMKVYGGSWYLTTFDRDVNPVNCIYDRVENHNETCAEAADYCASDTSPVIEINCPT